MKGCGFHQSDAAHHLHWGLCGWAAEFSVSGVAPPCASSESESEAAAGPDPGSIRGGVAKAGQTAVSLTGTG